MGRRFQILSLIVVLLSTLMISCATPESRSSEEVYFGEKPKKQTSKVTQAELLQDLQRFSSVFLERVVQAENELAKNESPQVREEAMRLTLRYASSVLDIVSEPSPEIALLDLLVFMRLSRETLEAYWVPRLFKKPGELMVRAFQHSELEIWAIADKVSTPQQQQQLKNLIARWRRENPTQIRVESVRLIDFSKKAGKIASDRSESAGGLLSSVSSGVEVADDALLMADRVLYLAQRIPFLLRMHASLGAGEIVSSITSELQSEGFLNGTMQNAHSLAGMAGQAAHEGTRFAQSLYPFLPQLRNLTQNLSSANHLASQSVDILDRLNAMSPAGMQRLDQFIIRVLVYFFIFGVGMAAIWWSAYYFVKRRLTHQAKEDSLRTENNRKSA